MAEEKIEEVTPKEGGSPNPDQVSIDRAELDSLKAKGVTFDEIAAKAKVSDYDDPKAYVDEVENELTRLYAVEAAIKPEVKPEVKTEVKTEVKPEVGLSEADLRSMEATNLRSTQAFLQAQKTEFKVTQMSLPEDKRTNITDNDLLKVINDKSLQPLISNLAGKFDGNVFTAAAHYMSYKEGIETARKEGAASQAAIEAAAGTASLGTGGKVPDVTNKSAEEKVAEANKIAADDIAPDDEPFEMEK